jgi:adenine deaminase
MLRLVIAPLLLLVAAFAAQSPRVSSLAQIAGAPAGVLAIRNVTVVPATGGAAMPARTVLVRGDRIAAIGPATAVAIPAGARVVDGAGKFLLPGLIDMHVHLSKTRGSAMGLFVANGVTTVRDMGGDYEELVRWRDCRRRCGEG